MQKRRPREVRSLTVLHADIDGLGLMLEQWKRAHINHPSRGKGIQILEHLMNSPDCLKGEVKSEEFKLENHVTEAELLEDIQNHKGYFNLEKECKSWTWIKFWKGWGAMRDYGDPNIPNHSPLTAFDVVSTSRMFSL